MHNKKNKKPRNPKLQWVQAVPSVLLYTSKFVVLCICDAICSSPDLSYRSLPVRKTDRSVHSPLTFHINKAFVPAGLFLAGSFPPPCTILCVWRLLCVKFSRAQQFQKNSWSHDDVILDLLDFTLAHDWLIGWLHEPAGVQVFLFKVSGEFIFPGFFFLLPSCRR